MARDYFDESKNKKKKKTKAATTNTSQSSSVAKTNKTVNNVNDKAQKSTFLGGGSTNSYQNQSQKPKTVKKPAAQKQTSTASTSPRQTTPQRTTDTGTGRRRTQTTAAQRQKMGMPTSEDISNARTSRRTALNKVDDFARRTTARANEWEKENLSARNQMLETQRAAKNKKTAERASERMQNKYGKQELSEKQKAFSDYTSGVIQRKALGYAKTASDLLKTNEGYKAQGRWAQEDPEFARRISSHEFAKRADKAFNDYSVKQEEVQKRLSKIEDNASGAGKIALQAYGSGLEMGVDRLAGPLWAVSMFASAYGNQRGQALKEGASDEQDSRAAFLGAGVEVATEYMFKPVAGIASKFGGKHSMDFAGKLAAKVTSKLTGNKARIADIAVRTLGSQVEEGLEEVAGWAVNPYAQNLAYKNDLQKTREANAHADYNDMQQSFWNQFDTEEEAQQAALYVNSDEFIDDQVKTYKESGATDEEARSMARILQKYFLAHFDNDEEAAEEAEAEMDRFVVGDVREKHDWKELGQTLASTFLLTGVTGGASTYYTNQIGNQMLQGEVGKDRVKQYTDIVIKYDPDNAKDAKYVKDTIDNGGTPTGTQVYQVASQATEVLQEMDKRETASDQVKQRRMREEDLQVPPVVMTARGPQFNEMTGKAYQASYDKALGVVRGVRKHGTDVGLSEDTLTSPETMRTAANAVAAYETGTITAEQINDLTIDNPEIRTIFELATGVDLAQYNVTKRGKIDEVASNNAMMNGLLANAADNYVQMARAEQKQWSNRTRGRVLNAMSTSFGEKGNLAMHDVLKATDPRNQQKYMLTARIAQNVYDYARRTDISWDRMKNAYKGSFKDINIDAMKDVYDAAKMDKDKAETAYLGREVIAGEAMRFEKSDNGVARVVGEFTNDSSRELTGEEDEAMRAVADRLGVNIRIVPDSEMTIDGRMSAGENAENAPRFNGSYDSSTNTILLAETNGLNDNILYAMSHETTHLLKQYAPDAYMKLSNYIMDKYYKNAPGKYEAEIKAKQDLYKRVVNQDLSEEAALEEIIADATRDFWSDPEFVNQISNDIEEPGFFKSIVNAIRDMLRHIRNLLSSGHFDGTEHEDVLWDLLGTYSKAEKLWLDAYRQAARNRAQMAIDELQDKAFKAEPRHSIEETTAETEFDNTVTAKSRTALEDKGVDVTESGTAVRFSLASWNDTDKEDLLNRLVEAGYDKDAADKWIDQVNSVASIILDDMGRLNYIADRYQPALKPNSEYYYTLDLSTLCQKRRLYQGTYNAIMDRIVNYGLTPADTVRLRQIMSEMKKEVPCGICYEESRKKNEGKFAETWLNGQTDKEWNQKLKDYDKRVEKYHQKLAEYEALEDKGKKKPPKEPEKPVRWLGYANMEHEDSYVPTIADVTTTTGRDRLRAEGHTEALEAYIEYQKGRGSANPKVSFTHTDYRGDILRMSKTDIDNVKHIGGLRIQSFSDFETVHVIDMMQAIMDMASMKLTSQAYTKVPAFADIFGGTGVKINLSLIQKMDENGNPVYDEDGKLVFDPVEGIDPDEADRIRKKYPKNVGTILVGVSDQQILDAWADDRVDMVIPFHRSGWSLDEFEKLGLKGYEDYQSYQSERYFDSKEKKWISLADAKMEGIYSADYWDKNLSGKENAERYLALCAEKHYRPVFYNFLHDNGDGTWSLQEDGSTDGYWKSLIDYKMYDNDGVFAPQEEVQPIFDMEVAEKVMADYEGNADTLPVAEDVVEAYLKDYKKRHPKNKFNMDDAKFSIAADLDEPYMAAINSGNMEEAQRLVDEAAKAAGFDTPLLHHGTPSFGFTTFDLARGENIIFATNSRLTAETYSGETSRNRISEKSKVDIDQLYGQGLLDKAKQHMSRYKDYRLMSGSEKEDLLDEARSEMASIANDVAAGFIAEHRDAFDAEKLKIANRIVDSLNKISTAWNDDDVQTAWDDFQDAIWDLKWADESIQLELSREIQDGGPLQFLRNRISDFMYAGDLYARGDSTSEYVYDNQLALELGAELNKGIYGLYGNPGKQLVIDANGSNWNQIIPPDELELYGPQRTRSIAEAAKAKGYDSVLFKDLRDNGGATAYNGESDVYMFFNPNQVKSADPVTYAEDGSVIPLSERFDPTNNDIRYSLPTQDSDGNILTDGQMEYFKNSQARDSQGRLIPMYHVTPIGGFTVFDPSYSFDETSISFSNSLDFALNYSSDDGNPDDWRIASETRLGSEEMDDDQIGYYQTYLNMRNPLILEGDYLDERDIYEWPVYAKAEGYDGVIYRDFDDGADIYQVFSGNQVKDTRNENPTENPDIRYSIPDEDMVKRYIEQNVEDIHDIPLVDFMLEQNRQNLIAAEEAFQANVSERWNRKSESYIAALDDPQAKASLRSIMREVRKNSGTKKQYKSETLEDVLKDVKQMHKYARASNAEMFAKTAWEAAEKIIDDIDYNDDLYEKYVGVKKYLDKARIVVPEEYFYMQDFAEFARSIQGFVRFYADGISLEKAYGHLSKKYPDLFPSDVNNAVDMLMQIADVIDYTIPYRDTYSSEEYSSLVEEVASNLCELVENGKDYKTTIEKLKVDAMNQRHQEALRKAEARHQEQLDESNARTEAQRQRAEKWKQRYNDRVQKGIKDRKERSEKEDHRKYFTRIQKNYKKLCDWVLKPTKEKNVPEEFRKSLAEFLQTLDLQTENSKKLEAKTGHVGQKTLKLRELKDRLNALAKSKTTEDGDYISGGFEIDAYAAHLMDMLSDKYDGKSVDELDALAIRDIDVVLKTIIKNIQRYKQVKTETKMAEISDVGGRGVEFLKAKIDRDGPYSKRKGAPGALQTINATALTPPYLFERLGPIKEMYDALRHNGFDTYIRNEKMIIDRLADILGKYNKTNRKGQNMPGSIVEEWRDERSAQTIQLTYGSVTMSVAQMMSLYCLSKRGEQALGHMLVGGIKTTPIQTTSKIAAEEKKKMSKASRLAKRTKNAAGNYVKSRFKGETETAEKLVLTYDDVQTIISKLTPDQKDVADKLQNLMSVDMARLGNEAHRELYGYEMFDEDFYFPIKVDSNQRETDINTIGEVFEKIKSFGFAKPLTPNANKAIIIDDIFSIVADHCNGMNLYNSYLVPITDFMKVLNYTHTFEDGTTLSMKDAIEQAYGSDMLKYVLNLMKDINGIKAENRGGMEGLMNRAIGRAKKTAVFGNVRVALQQPTAIVRAAAEINPKYLKGVSLPQTVASYAPFARYTSKAMEEMWKYCPIAQWKAWGYYDTYMGKDIEDVMMNNWSIGDDILSGYYGQLDNATWAVIWQAVKAEQADKYPDMDHNSEEFLQICGRRASEVFDKTQVVDSTFHRSDAMRSKQVATKLLTAFMAEPTLTMNVFRAALYNAKEASRAGNKSEAAKIRTKAIFLFATQAITVAAAQAFADAWRGKDPGLPWGDDDDDEKMEKAGYWTRWLHNFVYNCFDQLHIENNIYLVKDLMPYINFAGSKAADYANLPPFVRALLGWDQDYLYSQNNLVMSSLENTARGIGQVFNKLEKGEDYINPKTKEEIRWYDIIQKTSSLFGILTGVPAPTLMRDFKPIWDFIFQKAFAADTELMDAVANKMGYKPIEGSSKGSSSDNTDKVSMSTSDDEGGTNVPTRESLPDNLTDEQKDEIIKSAEKRSKKATPEEEQGQLDYDTMLYNALKAASGLEGEEYNKKVYSSVANGLKGYIADGDYVSIGMMRTVIEEAGGDVEYFDKRVMEESKTAYKKTLSYDQTLEERNNMKAMYRYMMSHGMTQEELSNDVLYSSELAKDMKVAYRFGDNNMIYEAMLPLVDAGITRTDLERLYENRNKMDLAKYKKTGRYKDKLKSMGTFIWPATGPITSHFGYRTDVASVGGSTDHPAIDIGIPVGTPVVAADGGVVILAGSNYGYGYSVGIKHDNGMVTYYNHLDSWNVKVGDTVAQGQQIACSGNTGRSTGPHLDFKILDKNGKPVNPEKLLSGSI